MRLLVATSLFILISSQSWAIDVQMEFNPNGSSADLIKDAHAIDSDGLLALKQSVSQGHAPTMCDISTAENGKYKSCQCDPTTVDIQANTPNGPINNTVVLSVPTSFNTTTQLCEKSGNYTFTINGYTCADGIQILALRRLQRMKLTSYKDDLKGVLGICYQDMGTYTLEVLDETKMHSIYDVVIFSAVPSSVIPSPNGTQSLIDLDPASINY